MEGQYTRRGSQAQRGFSLLEAVFALLIFAGMALIFAAVFPIAAQSSKADGEYAAAAALAQHKVEQLRGTDFVTIQNPALLAARGILDSGSAAASVPYSSSFTQVDHLAGAGDAGLFPSGTVGTLTVNDYNTLNPAVPAGTVDTVTVAVQWQNGSSPPASYSLSSLVIQMPHS